MTLSAVPFCMDGTTEDAQLIRTAVASLVGQNGGAIAPNDFAVTQQTVPNMSVAIGPGRAWIPGNTLPFVVGGAAFWPQGLYYAENDAPVTISINAANPSNPRVDTLIIQVRDIAYAGANKDSNFVVLPGTPSAGANLTNLTGVAAVPASSMVVAYILVPAAATSIVTADIAYVMPVANSGFSGAWQPLTLNPSVGSGVVTGTGTNVAAARRQGDTVKLRGYFQITIPPTSPGALYATLPAGTRPLAPVSFATINPTGSGVTVEQVNIDTSGHLTITDALAGALPIYLEGMNFSLT